MITHLRTILCPGRVSLFYALVLVFLSWPVPAQESSQQQAKDKDYYERRDAYELYRQNRFVEALPLFDKLVAAHPDDMALEEALAACVMSSSVTLKDPEARKGERIRARKLFLRAKELGDDSNYLKTMLVMLPEDGSESAFSPKAEIDEIMRVAEADFVRGDLDKARDGYIRALLLDPDLYDAALFTGDVFYKQNKLGAAGEWFARAIQINADRETAYRYWGDALMAAGKMEEARSKFIEAVIAEPYNNSPRMGLSQWADGNKVGFHLIKVKPRSSFKIEDGKTVINIDPGSLKDDKKDDGTSAWMIYGISRAAWQGERFKKEFPNEAKYRHSLKEEADALGSVATVALEMREGKKKKKSQVPLDAEIAELVRLKQSGFLEPYILLFSYDDGIMQDYAAYRAANRDTLRRYLDESVVPKLSATGTAKQE